MKSMTLWFAMFCFVAFGIYLEGGHLRAFVQMTAVMIVLGPVLCYLIHTYGVKGTWKFFRRLLNHQIDVQDNHHIDTAVTLGFLFSALGSVAGMIHVMENLTDTSRLGTGIAVAFISAVYGLVPAIMLVPLKKGQSTQSVASSIMKKAAGFMVMTLMLLGGSFFVVLYATSNKG